MGTYEDLKAAIQQVIRTNGNNEITGALLQQTLLSIINSVGANAAFAGIATPDTNPGTADQNIFYIATEPGTYANFGGIEIAEGEAVILSNKTGNWTKIISGCATQRQLTELESEIQGVGVRTILLEEESYAVTSAIAPFLTTHVVIDPSGGKYAVYIKANYIGKFSVVDVVAGNEILFESPSNLDFSGGQEFVFDVEPRDGRFGFLTWAVTTLDSFEVSQITSAKTLDDAINDKIEDAIDTSIDNILDIVNTDIASINDNIDKIEADVYTEFSVDDILWVDGVVVNNNSVIEATLDKTSQPFILHKGVEIIITTQGDGNFWFSALSQVSKNFYTLEGAKTVQSLITIDTNNWKQYSYTATEDIYIVVSVRNNEYAEIEIIGDNRSSKFDELSINVDEFCERLKGLKWCACGDSFTYGDMGDATDTLIEEEGKYQGEKANYPNIIGNRYNMDIILNAQNGWRMVTTGGSGFSSDYGGGYYAIPNNCDLITLAFGLNELNAYGGLSYAEGDVDSTDAETVRGAWNKVIKHILTNIPNARLGVIIMDGWMSSIYSDLLKEICASWGIPYLELFSRVDVCLLVPHDGEEYQKAPFATLNTEASALRDSLYNAGNDHPSKYANYARANLIAEWLKTL